MNMKIHLIINSNHSKEFHSAKENLLINKSDLRMSVHMYTCGGFILIFGKSNTVMLSLKIK